MKHTALLFVFTLATIVASCYSHSAETYTCKAGCSDDCTILTQCSEDVPVQVNCPIQTNWKKPFCNSEEYICDSTPDFCTPKGAARCDLRDGFYPNLLNCEKFYYCDAKKHQKIEYTCQEHAHFNAVTQKCEFNSSCIVFDEGTGFCKGKNGKLIVHPQRKNLYVLCNNVPLLFQCVADDHYIFDEESAACIFVCSAEGMFPDAEKVAQGDLTHYYECVKSGTTFKRYHKQCPAGSIFDGTKCKLIRM